MPPRSCLAQVVTVRPRSAAQSTNTLLPSKRTSGSCRASCRITQGSSPSGSRTLLPPPRKRCGTPACFSMLDQFGKRFVLADNQKVGGPANFQRSFRRERNVRPVFDAQRANCRNQFGIVNAHVSPGLLVAQASACGFWSLQELNRHRLKPALLQFAVSSAN